MAVEMIGGPRARASCGSVAVRGEEPLSAIRQIVLVGD
jgi:hypothetical protein